MIDDHDFWTSDRRRQAKFRDMIAKHWELEDAPRDSWLKRLWRWMRGF